MAMDKKHASLGGRPLPPEITTGHLIDAATGDVTSLKERRIVRVGVAVIVRQGPMVLMGLRKGAHGAGTWSLPGGHLEPGEDIKEAAARELGEETGIELSPSSFRRVAYTNDVFPSDDGGQHYVTLYVEVPASFQYVAKVMEPEKCEKWAWYGAPPEPLFLPIRNLLADGFELWPRTGGYGR
jgi:8-oxo-dGTP diphosphatase